MTTFAQIASQKAFCVHLSPRAITAVDAKDGDNGQDGDGDEEKEEAEEKSPGEDFNLC